MDTRKYLVAEKKRVGLSQFASTDKKSVDEKELREKLIPESIEKLKALHMKLHAQEKKGYS